MVNVSVRSKLAQNEFQDTFFLKRFNFSQKLFFFDKKQVFSLFNFPQKSFFLTKKHVFSLFNFLQKSFFFEQKTRIFSV